jgi:hypothetical protein
MVTSGSWVSHENEKGKGRACNGESDVEQDNPAAAKGLRELIDGNFRIV